MRFAATPLIAFAIFSSMAITPATAQAPTVSAAPASPHIAAFFDLLKTGDADKAVTSVLETSLLWENRMGVKEQMVAQIDAAGKIYGPFLSYECQPALRTGTLVVRQYCLAQHRQMVVRWQFDLAKLPDGWSVAYFGFNDQIHGWPDGE